MRNKSGPLLRQGQIFTAEVVRPTTSGPAMTQDSAYYFFAPGVGVVAMISQENATAFWIIHIDTTSGKVLMSK